MRLANLEESSSEAGFGSRSRYPCARSPPRVTSSQLWVTSLLREASAVWACPFKANRSEARLRVLKRRNGILFPRIESSTSLLARACLFLNALPFGQSVDRIRDQRFSGRKAIQHLDRCAEIASELDRYIVNSALRRDHNHSGTLAIHNKRIGRNDDGSMRPRQRELHLRIHARQQSTIFIRQLHFCE